MKHLQKSAVLLKRTSLAGVILNTLRNFLEQLFYKTHTGSCFSQNAKENFGVEPSTTSNV